MLQTDAHTDRYTLSRDTNDQTALDHTKNGRKPLKAKERSVTRSRVSKIKAGLTSPFLDGDQTEAEAAWSDGRYSDLIGLGEKSHGWATVMSAFAHLRRDEPEAALQALARVKTSGTNLIPRSKVLRAQAMRVLGQFDNRITEGFGEGDLDEEARGLANYFDALLAIRRNQLGIVDEILSKPTSGQSEWLQGAHRTLAGWVEFREARVGDALHHFRAATQHLAASPIRDSFLHMNAIFGLATCALDGLNLTVLPLLQDSLKLIPSRTDFAQRKTLCLSRVAQVLGLAGQEDEAFDLLLEARFISAANVYAAEPLLELFDFHHRLGETYTAKLHRARTKRVLDGVTWSHATIDERLYLLQLSTQFSHDDEQLASQMFMRAVSTEGRIDSSYNFENDERARAFAMYAEGFLFQARSEIARAIECWRNAISIWAANGYGFRAAQAEVLIIKNSEIRPLTPNLQIAGRNAPRSWLARVATAPMINVVADVTQQPPAPRLSQEIARNVPKLGRAEQRVLELICEGLSGPEIAAKVGRSLSTVKNQTIRIFRSYGVNDRKSLIEKARREPNPPAGLTSDLLGKSPGRPTGNHDDHAAKNRAKGDSMAKNR